MRRGARGRRGRCDAQAHETATASRALTARAVPEWEKPVASSGVDDRKTGDPTPARTHMGRAHRRTCTTRNDTKRRPTHRTLT